MPKGDGTGPAGMGSMTGRRAGFCAGFRIPGYINSCLGRGLGFGLGRGSRRLSWIGSLLPACAYLAYCLTKRGNIK
jgi:hypothetical protein